MYKKDNLFLKWLPSIFAKIVSNLKWSMKFYQIDTEGQAKSVSNFE